MSRNEELIGVWNGADYVFDNGDDRRCVIGSLRLLNREQTTLRGYAAEHELIGGVTYRFYGHFRNHPKHGRQFAFNSFVEEAPVDEDSVLAYLTQCRKPERGSITDRVARALFEEFGLESISKLIADPVGAAMNVKQWGAEKAAIASEYLRTQEGTRNCKLALIGILDGRGFPKKTVDRAIKEWGAAAAKVVKTDPYELMKLPGIGFKGADKLYCDLSREAAKTDEEYQQALGSMKRQGLCVAYYVNTESRQSGDTWVPIGMAKAAVSRLISSTHAKPNEAIEWAVLNGRLVVRDAFCANARMALHELEIAEFMTGSEEVNEWPDIDLIRDMAPEGKPLSQHQLEAIQIATSQRVGCLQGSPGVGKTFAVACIAKAVIRKYGEDLIGLAAPTGKAGVRMSQSLAANGVKVPASTIHRLLGVEGQEGDGWRFHYNDQNPLPQKMLVIDECFVAGTMIDVNVGQMPIQDIKPGQVIRNAIGFDCVVATSRRIATHVTKINVGEKEILCSPNHQFFTTRGFVFASELKSGDSIVRTSEAVRLLWNGDKTKAQEQCDGSFLQYTLLSEMVDAVSGIQEPRVHSRACKEMWTRENEIPELRERGSCRANRKDSQPEPNEEQVFSGCLFEETSGNQTQASNSGREWKRTDKAAICTDESDRGWMGYRIRGERMGENSRLSNMLQAGPCESEETDRNRNRRSLSQHNSAEKKRQEERFFSVGERVDCVEIFESASPELDRFRDADGFVYLYDLQAARHKSYSVDGLLVHNCSMIDTDIMASLLRACTPSMHLLFIGDSNQLAPVGHGRPFYDLQSCIPTGHLTEIRRNSGKIVEACAEIRDRNTISFSPQISLPADNLTLIAAGDEQQVQVLEDVIGIIGNNDGDTIEDLQIVTGKNDGSEVARKPLNKMLQKLFNANGHCMHGNPFRVGDKIVCLKNGTYPDAEEQTDEHFVANGELGRVIEIHPGRMTVRLSDPVREIKIIHAPVQENEREVADSEDSQRGAVGDWDLGYALSVHRSQGSQWKYVIVMADSKGGMVQTRNWIYTAISRAEIATWVIGQRQVVNQMMRRDGISNRKTFLVERINEQRGLVSVDFDELFAEV